MGKYDNKVKKKTENKLIKVEKPKEIEEFLNNLIIETDKISQTILQFGNKIVMHSANLKYGIKNLVQLLLGQVPDFKPEDSLLYKDKPPIEVKKIDIGNNNTSKNTFNETGTKSN